MQVAVERVHVAPSVQEYCVDLVSATRASPSTAVGASPRGSLALLKLARCRAALAGRDYVLPDDVKAIAVPALAHRLVLRPELQVQRVSSEDVVREVLETVPTPRAEDVATAPHVTRTASPRLSATRRSPPSGWSPPSPYAGPRLAVVAPRPAPRNRHARRSRAQLSIDVHLAHERTLEGAVVEAVVAVGRSGRSTGSAPPAPAARRGGRRRLGRRTLCVSELGESRDLDLGLRCARWGVFDVGRVDVRARDALRLVTWEVGFEDLQRLKAYPSP